MQIAIDVNDNDIATKILSFLSSFKKEIKVTTSIDDINFSKNRESLHKIHSKVIESRDNLCELDANFWDEMGSIIKNA